MKNITLLSSDRWSAITSEAIRFRMEAKDSVMYPSLRYEVYYPNGYGALIVKDHYTSGRDDELWELYVLKGNKICVNTPIATDILEGLNDEEVGDCCRQISLWQRDRFGNVIDCDWFDC